MIFTLLLLALISLFYIYVKWRQSYWSRYGVPSLEPTFFIGNIGPILSLKENIGILHQRWYNDFPTAPYVGFYKFLKPAIMFRDPDLIKDILTRDFQSFAANDFNISEKHDALLATNPFMVNDEKWKRLRATALSTVSPNKVKAYYPMMVPSCEKLVNYLKTKPPTEDIEAKALSMKFTTQNVVSCGFSYDAKAFDPEKSEIVELAEHIFASSFLTGIKLFVMPIVPKWLLDHLPVSFMSPESDRWFRNVVTSNKESRKDIPMKSEDIMQTLLTHQEKHHITDEEISGHILNFFLDGFETSSGAMSLTFYELAKSLEIQEKVHEEIVDALGRHDNTFSYDTLQEMTYLDCVIMESMRLHPAASVLGKLSTKDYTLPKLPNQNEAVTIPAGTSTIIPVLAIHHDANYYTDPEVFDPNRYSAEERHKRNKVLSLPFGEGQRACIGQRFAMVQIKAALMHILKDFKVTLSPNHKPLQYNPKLHLTAAKDGILLNFTQRT